MQSATARLFEEYGRLAQRFFIYFLIRSNKHTYSCRCVYVLCEWSVLYVIVCVVCVFNFFGIAGGAHVGARSSDWTSMNNHTHTSLYVYEAHLKHASIENVFQVPPAKRRLRCLTLSWVQ